MELNLKVISCRWSCGSAFKCLVQFCPVVYQIFCWKSLTVRQSGLRVSVPPFIFTIDRHSSTMASAPVCGDGYSALTTLHQFKPNPGYSSFIQPQITRVHSSVVPLWGVKARRFLFSIKTVVNLAEGNSLLHVKNDWLLKLLWHFWNGSEKCSIFTSCFTTGTGDGGGTEFQPITSLYLSKRIKEIIWSFMKWFSVKWLSTVWAFSPMTSVFKHRMWRKGQTFVSRLNILNLNSFCLFFNSFSIPWTSIFLQNNIPLGKNGLLLCKYLNLTFKTVPLNQLGGVRIIDICKCI